MVATILYLCRMMKKLLLLLLFSAAQLMSSGQTPVWMWAKKACSLSNATSITAVTTDLSGNIFIAGNFRDSAMFGTGIYHPTGTMNLFVAKYDSLGSLLWMRSAKGPNSPPYDLATALCTDAAGNCYATGFFNGPAVFNNDTIVSTGSAPDVFVVKYDPSGNVAWLTRGGGTGSDYAYGIAVDSAGTCYVGGFFDASATFGTTTLTANNSSTDIFIGMIDTHGGFSNAVSAGGSAVDVMTAMSQDAQGNCYVTGTFNSPSITFGNSTITYTGSGTDAYVAKFNPAGVALWGQSAGGPANQEPSAIATDRTGNCYVTGVFKGDTMYFGNTTLTTYYYWDMFTARYDSSGNLMWAKHQGSASFGPDVSLGIATDSAGNCYTTGRFSTPATFDTITVNAAGPADIFVAKFDSGGTAEWVKQSGSSSNVLSSASIHRTASGSIFITGSFEQNTTLGFDSLTADPGFTAGYYIAKLDLINTTSVAEHSVDNDRITLFPVPVQQSLYISPAQINAIAAVYDVCGKQVCSLNLINGRTADVGQLSPGIYFLELINGDVLTREKFIKQ